MYKIILSFRYLFRRRISYLALGAVALSVFIVVVVMTVMTGLVGDFKVKNHKFAGDCVVGTESLVGFPYYEEFAEQLGATDFVQSVSPVVSSYALVSVRGDDEGVGLELMGIDPAVHAKVTGFGEGLYYHRADAANAFVPAYNAELAGCVVGIDKVLGRNARGEYEYEASPVGMALMVTCFPLTARGALAKAGTDLVNTKTFYFSDSSQSGIARVDSSVIYVPISEAQGLCGMDGAVKRVSRLCVKFAAGVELAEGCSSVAGLWREFAASKHDDRYAYLLQTVQVQSWKTHRRQFIAAMEKEQTMMTALFALVGVTTVFIVFVVFYMIVSHKSKDIGILKSIGVSEANIVGVFVIFAFWTGLLGSGIGVILGVAFLRNINTIESWLFEHLGFQLWDRTIYAIGDIPNQTDAGLLAVVVLSAVVSCMLSALLPSRQAAKQEPVEILQVSQL